MSEMVGTAQESAQSSSPLPSFLLLWRNNDDDERLEWVDLPAISQREYPTGGLQISDIRWDRLFSPHLNLVDAAQGQ